MGFAAVKQIGSRVIVKLENSPSCDKEVVDYLHAIEKIYDKNERFIILYDCLNVDHVSWRHIWMQAKFMKDQEARTKQLMVRAAIVTRSSSKKLLNILFTLRKPSCDLEVFDNMDRAKEYLRNADGMDIGEADYNRELQRPIES